MNYFTFVGNHDFIDASRAGYGAALSIFLQYQSDIDTVFLFITAPRRGEPVNYRDIADQNKAIMLREKPEVEVHFVSIDLANPIDFDLVYPVMLDATQKIFENEEIRSRHKIINITSGTPTMTACWVLLHKSGLIPNSRLVQSFESKYARSEGKTTQEVNFEIDDFPQISVPKELKRRLTIATREKKQLTERLNALELDRQIPELVGQSEAIREIKELILNDIDAETHVLILGERGTGKQVVADAIWRLYHREDDTSLTICDCGTLSETLLLSELFGHTRGAFTSATEDRVGLLRQCENRMLFLDEIGNLPMNGQRALLRFVADGEVRPLGSDAVHHVDAQVIAATNKNIHDSTLFAQDLKDRFDEIIELPPLRSRREDIPVLVDHFLPIYTKKQGLRSPLTLHKEV
ncbi:MAG: RNA repair transcriptional activator RtcR family protein, partial [bacterium]